MQFLTNDVIIMMIKYQSIDQSDESSRHPCSLDYCFRGNTSAGILSVAGHEYLNALAEYT